VLSAARRIAQFLANAGSVETERKVTRMDDKQRHLMMQVGAAVLLFVVGGLVGWIGHSLSTPHDSVSTLSAYEDWRLACPARETKDAHCVLGQDVNDAKTGTGLAKIALVQEPKKGMQFIVTGPFDVALDPGMGLVVGKEKIRVTPFETCTQGGCVASLPADDKLMSSLRTADKAQLVYMTLANKPVALPFSLKGFVTADDARQSQEARFSSFWWRLWS
jgi:invasion protein IalB